MKTLTRLILITALVSGTALCLTGCNTAEGFGEDLQQVGQQIEEDVET